MTTALGGKVNAKHYAINTSSSGHTIANVEKSCFRQVVKYVFYRPGSSGPGV